MGAWQAYAEALRHAGVMAGGKGLEPPATATTVRFRGGERTVQDGPYADTKEQLGGFFIIDVPDLDAALDWAARCPVDRAGRSRSGRRWGAARRRPTGRPRPSPPWRRSDPPMDHRDGRPPGRRGGGPR